MRKFLLIFCFSLLLFKISSQDKKQSSKDMLLEAESYFLYEEYGEALPLYLKLSKEEPTNDNFNFKIGVCYQNIPYEKEKSITYLEKAIKNIDPNYKPTNIKETQSPIDAMFYLANAYRINDQLDKALETYTEFRKKCNPEIFDLSLVDDQIKTIERAKHYEANPIYFVSKNLGETINSKFAETNAVISGDEDILIYNVKLQFYDAMYYTTKVNGQWQPPVNIIPDLGVDGDVYATSLSYDGNELFIYRSDNYDGNIYSSRFADGHWHPIKRLNDNINTKYWESHASVSADGKTLYFTSNRKGGFGGLDIYSATRPLITQDDWGFPRNLGPEINTPYNEETPFIAEDGKTLFFSSYGHFNMGGYDIFYSTLLDNGKWTAPLNMGYPMNTTDDDLFFCPVKDGNFAYVCRYYPNENYGKTDIYKVEMFSSQHPRKFILKGLVNLPFEMKDDKFNIIIKLVNKSNQDTIQKLLLESVSPNFNTKLTAGNYQLIVEGKGIQKSIDEFTLKTNQANDEISLNPSVKALPIEKEKPQVKIEVIKFIKNYYKVFDSKNIYILLPIERGSDVMVDISSNSLPVKTENFQIKKDKQYFSFIPIAGENILHFKAISPENKVSEGEIIIQYEPLPDTTNAQSAEELAKKQYQLNLVMNFMKTFAEGNLKSALENIDLVKEHITSIDDLIRYLKSNAGKLGYQPEEIDLLLKEYYLNEPLAAKLFIGAISYLADSALKPVSRLAETTEFKTVTDAISFLIDKSSENSTAKLSLLSATSRLADNENVYYYYQALKKVTRGNLKNLLDTLNLNNEHISTPEQLLDLLLQRGSSSGYSKDDVYKGFLVIPAFTTVPSEMLSVLIGLADDGLKSFLAKIEINNSQIKTTSDFGLLLYDKALNTDVPIEDIIKLLFKANRAAGLKQLITDIRLFAANGLKTLADSIARNQNRFASSNELLNYILSKDNNKLAQLELTKIFTHIASVNLLKAYKFNYSLKKGFRIKPVEIGLLSVFVILLVSILLFIFRKKKKE